jgi:hypothetical protein
MGQYVNCVKADSHSCWLPALARIAEVAEAGWMSQAEMQDTPLH